MLHITALGIEPQVKGQGSAPPQGQVDHSNGMASSNTSWPACYTCTQVGEICLNFFTQGTLSPFVSVTNARGREGRRERERLRKSQREEKAARKSFNCDWQDVNITSSDHKTVSFLDHRHLAEELR